MYSWLVKASLPLDVCAAVNLEFSLDCTANKDGLSTCSSVAFLWWGIYLGYQFFNAVNMAMLASLHWPGWNHAKSRVDKTSDNFNTVLFKEQALLLISTQSTANLYAISTSSLLGHSQNINISVWSFIGKPDSSTARIYFLSVPSLSAAFGHDALGRDGVRRFRRMQPLSVTSDI